MQTLNQKDKPKTFSTLKDIVHQTAEILQPPERLTVSQAAAKYRMLNNPGSYVGPWLNETTAYMVEPMDVLTQREYNACIFVGPAQCAKTDALLLNWVNYGVICDPADMLLIEKSQAAARDFSRRRLDRLHRHTRAAGDRLVKRRDSDNTFDKFYTSGMMLTLSYPAINELSGRPIPRVALTDYDRMPQDIDGEGSPFDLARKRTTTFRSFAMTLAESSPGYSIDDVRWLPQSTHEAAPCPGILALYNRGDRRRFYWPCPHCSEFFEGDFDLLTWNDSADMLEAAESAKMACPQCAALIDHGMKYDLNLSGRWVKDGQKIAADGTLNGLPSRSDIASFWIKGTAAAFASWRTLVLNYLKALQEFERTGSQEALKSTVNTDQGKPYYPKGSEEERLPEDLKSRCEQLGDRVVPEGARFLLACADTQKNMWVVQVFGIGKGGDIWLVDRIEIKKSGRLDADGEHLWVKPAAYLEDWDLLVEQVLKKTYPLATDATRHMQIKMMTCDSGGAAGVSNNAYDFWRKLRDAGDGAHRRFFLIKGDPKVGAPRVHVSYPDSSTIKGSRAGARGEVPVLMLNVNVLKDRLNAMLDRTLPEGGEIHMPDWLEDNVFVEMTVERRTIKGWENPKSYRNEAWDLFTYCVGLCVHLRVEHLNWDNPPGWAQEWDKNDLVFKFSPEHTLKFANTLKSSHDLRALANELG
jgi:phage terminase large subunit GpA-like protein